MQRQILRIAIPSIVSNVTVPLLALVDTSIVGHLGAASYIGAIALGSLLFSMVYWIFGFLRMGTGGLTAQAFGAGREKACKNILLRSLSLALAISLVLVALQEPIVELAFRLISAPSHQVEQLARLYFHILIWGGPAMLCLYSFNGWFLGMQNARIPMTIAIVQNLINIAASLFLVLSLGWKVEGVAAGTLIAQYSGLLMAIAFERAKFHSQEGKTRLRDVFNRRAYAKFFAVNRDIFFRTLCLIAVTVSFTSFSALLGEEILAANTLLMQFFMFFSYLIDGFAYAGESLGGRFLGAHQEPAFRALTRGLFKWGAAIALAFTLVYVGLGKNILHLLTDHSDVLNLAAQYLPFAIAVPLLSFSAFLFDGLFIGLTATRGMLLSMSIATLGFFTLALATHLTPTSLWSAFLLYLGLRGAIQAILMRKIRKSKFQTPS